MDDVDRMIINTLQDGFPVCDRPYQQVAESLGIHEQELINRIEDLLDEGILSRFGPMYNIEKLGGVYTLAAMSVPGKSIDRVAAIINSFPEVAHNYERDHALNMWFVLATESEDDLKQVIEAIEKCTGLTVYNLPKQKEYYVGLKFHV